MTPDPEHDPLADLLAEYLDSKRSGKSGGTEEFLARCPQEHREALRRSISFVERAEGEVSAAAASARKLPERYGDYRIVRSVGQGGMGVVYEAEQISIPRKVALKLIAPWIPQDDQALGRLHREAQAIAKLRHPNIVTVYATGEQDGIRYFAMEFIPGRGLGELRAELAEQGKSIPIPKLLRWIAQIARALQAAHEAGVVHRDVKPSNILVTPDERVILIDFGLAQDAQFRSLAKTGEFRGSPNYASPEQVAAHREGLSPASDVYSLGATLYECVTGKLPFEGVTTEQIFHQILSKEPVSPRAINHLIPRDLETVIQKAMEKEPARRYESAAAFADDLEALLEVRPIQAAPTSVVTRSLKWARRNRGWAAAIVTGFAATVLTGGALYRQALVSSTLENYRVALRVREAIAAGREPEAGDKLHLQEILPDPAARTAFLRDPKSPEVWERIQRNLEEMPRSGEEPRLLRPRAGITNAQPTFRFRLPEGAMASKPMQLVLVSEKHGERSWPLSPADVARGEFAFPADAPPLDSGPWYRWTVRAQKQPANAPPSSNWSYFQFVEPAERDRLLAEVKPTGDAAMDRLLRATVLVTRGLAEEGLGELGASATSLVGPVGEYEKLLKEESGRLLGESF